MNLARHITCPRCHTPLKSARGVRIGKKIACPNCRIAFTVRPEDAESAELAEGINAGRLLIVLIAAGLYLVGGAGLAVLCFANNAPRYPVAQNPPQSAANPDDDTPDLGTQLPQPVAPKPSSITPQLQRKIDQAVADGVWYLKDHVHPDGSWDNTVENLPALSVGFTALPGLTLLECGLPTNDPVVKKAADLVRKECTDLGSNQRATYQLALAILFLDRLGTDVGRLGDPQDRALVEYLALCLVAGQHSDGGWSYACPAVDRRMAPQLLKQLADPKQSLADWHKAAGAAFPAGGWDNSNTQFAVLALWVAQRHQVSIDKPIELAEQHFRKTQLHAPEGGTIGDPTGNNVNLDGSWRYNDGANSNPWPSMTCSGLLGLAIGHGVAKDPTEKNQKPLDDPAIKAGLAMLAREIDRPGERRPPDHYFLWSVARVAVLYDLDKIDGKDWYAWGVKHLLPRQKNDGSWIDGAFYANHPVLNTCFALLFLKRANLAKDLTDKLQFLARLTSSPPPSVLPAKKKDEAP
jgi:hypothetical protein